MLSKVRLKNFWIYFSVKENIILAISRACTSELFVVGYLAKSFLVKLNIFSIGLNSGELLGVNKRKQRSVSFNIFNIVLDLWEAKLSKIKTKSLLGYFSFIFSTK